MLEIKCTREYYDKVIEFSKSIGKYEQLRDQLTYLTNYACKADDGTFDAGRTRCELRAEFLFTGQEPRDFYFTMFKRQPDGSYRAWFDGGLNFYNPTQTWSVNT